MFLPIFLSFARSEDNSETDGKTEGASLTPVYVLSSFMILFVFLFLILLVLGKKN